MSRNGGVLLTLAWWIDTNIRNPNGPILNIRLHVFSLLLVLLLGNRRILGDKKVDNIT